MKNLNKLLLAFGFMFFTYSGFAQQNNNSEGLDQLQQQEEMQKKENSQPIVPQTRPNAIETRNDRGTDATIEVITRVMVDYFASEGAWNLYDVDGGSYYFATDRTFASSYEMQIDTLDLTEGNEYEFHVWDSYGDGGIMGNAFYSVDNPSPIAGFATSDYYGEDNTTGNPTAVSAFIAEEGVVNEGDFFNNPLVKTVPFSHDTTSCNFNSYWNTATYSNGQKDVFYEFTIPEGESIGTYIELSSDYLPKDSVGLYMALYAKRDVSDIIANTRLNEFDDQIDYEIEDAGGFSDTLNVASMSANLEPGTYVLWVDGFYEIDGDYPNCLPYNLLIDYDVTFESFEPVLSTESTSDSVIVDLNWSLPEYLDEENVLSYHVVKGLSMAAMNDTISSLDTNYYADGNVVEDQEYFYKVGVEYVRPMLEDTVTEYTTTKSIMTHSGATFAITPESHNFSEVGVLADTVYYHADTVDFVITNTGIDTLIIDLPYFFSGETDDFELIGYDTLDWATDYSWPDTIVGPSAGTEEMLKFSVVFEPTVEADYNTLLVVNDNTSDRELRTFELTGSAYEIQDGDLMENAFAITNDWALESDYADSAMYDDFKLDYPGLSSDDADVVYHFTLAKDSYVTFPSADNENVNNLSVFVDNDTTEFIADHILATPAFDDELALNAGSYYVVISGDDLQQEEVDYLFGMNVEGQTPIFEVWPEFANLGEVPMDAWDEGVSFYVTNTGGQTITISDVLLSDTSNVFSWESREGEPPYTITDDTLEFKVYLDGASEEDTYGGSIIFQTEDVNYLAEFEGTSYEAPLGDVYENPVVATWNEVNDGYEFYHTGTVEDSIRENYNFDGDYLYGDFVYKFSYDMDMDFSMYLADTATNAVDAPTDPRIAIISANSNFSNPWNADFATDDIVLNDTIENLQLSAGTYYVIIAGMQDGNGEFSAFFNVENMPAPNAITLDTPEDGATDVELDSELEWTHDAEYTTAIDVYLGTQYPPQTQVANNLMASETSFDLAALDLERNTQYFWKVVARNTNDTTESSISGFTTALRAPHDVTATVYDYVNVMVEWQNPMFNTTEIYEDFEADTLLPEGWTMQTNATGTSAGWFVTDNGSSSSFSIPPHTQYAVANDDATGSSSDGSMDYLIMPVQNMAGIESATLTFDAFFDGSFGHSATVEITTDLEEGEWEVVHELLYFDDWREVTVDLSEYNSSEYETAYIAFHSDDNEGWASGFAVDNVQLQKTESNTDRALLGYNVYRNDQIIASSITETYYDDQDLTAGDYSYKVSAQYQEGESEAIAADPETVTILGTAGIKGTVTSALSNDSIANAIVEFAAIDTTAYYTDTTDAMGYYEIDLPVVETGYKVTVTADGFPVTTVDTVEVMAGEYTVQNFALAPAPTDVMVEQNEAETIATVSWTAPASDRAARALEGYNVYRFDTAFIDNQPAWTTVATGVEATEYDDESWVDVEMGVYKYAVEAVYNADTIISGPAISGDIGKDMWSNLAIVVSLNTGDSPEGVEISMEHTIVPDEHSYEFTVPASGTVTSDVWKGTYDLTVSLEGYETYEETVTIDETYFNRNIELQEALYPPVNLAGETDCKDVHLTWEDGTGTGGGTGDEFVEDFESGIPADWTFVDQDGDGNNWEYADDGTITAHSGEGVMFSASWDGAPLNPENWMITPELQVGNSSQLSFWYIAQDELWPGDYVEVKVSTTDNDPASFTETVGSVTAGTAYAQEMIDLSDFAGETVYVAFHHTNSSDFFYINIDDVEMSNATRVNDAAGYIASSTDAQPVKTAGMTAEEAEEAIANYQPTVNNSRELMGYNVYRDGELLNDEPISETEYWDMDVDGGKYDYTVSAIYTTGESPFAGPIEIDVANIDAPANLVAEKMSFNNVMLEWDEITDEALEGYHIFRNEEQISDELVTVPSFIDYDVDYPAEYQYYVVAEYAEGCISAASNIEVISFGVGIEDLAETLNVYPNPASDIVQLETTSDVEQIRIMNSLGQKVYTANNLGNEIVTVDVSNYEGGSYIVQFQTKEGNVINKRLVIVK